MFHYSHKKTLTASILVGAACVLAGPATAQEPVLSSTPAKCVSLKQGRTCYQDIAFHWKVAEVSNYCLYQQEITDPVKCWEQQNQGHLDYQFAEKSSITYILRKQGSNQEIASTSIEVKWVYKRSSDHYGWRIF